MLFVNDTYYTVNTIVRYNISQNDRKSIFRYSGSIDNVYNYNNTVYVGQASGNPVMSDYFTKASGTPRNIKNYNNVYYSVGDRGWDLRGQTFDYNAYYGGNTLVQADVHKVTADPKFVDPGSGSIGMNTVGGYKLQAGSPLIGAGIRINDNGGRDYFGNPLYNEAPDIGAHEYEGSVPPAGSMPGRSISYGSVRSARLWMIWRRWPSPARRFILPLPSRSAALTTNITTRLGNPRIRLRFRTILRWISAMNPFPPTS